MALRQTWTPLPCDRFASLACRSPAISALRHTSDCISAGVAYAAAQGHLARSDSAECRLLHLAARRWTCRELYHILRAPVSVALTRLGAHVHAHFESDVCSTRLCWQDGGAQKNDVFASLPCGTCDVASKFRFLARCCWTRTRIVYVRMSQVLWVRGLMR